MLADRRLVVAVFVGGFIGTVARAEVALVLPHDPGRWPWSTLVVNLAGAFLVGCFATRLLERRPVSAYRLPLLGAGFCGGLTTFSTMQLELLQMLDDARYGLAAGYAVVSVVAGFLAVALATSLVRRVR